jgi:hypothetical protein
MKSDMIKKAESDELTEERRKEHAEIERLRKLVQSKKEVVDKLKKENEELIS